MDDDYSEGDQKQINDLIMLMKKRNGAPDSRGQPPWRRVGAARALRVIWAGPSVVNSSNDTSAR